MWHVSTCINISSQTDEIPCTSPSPALDLIYNPISSPCTNVLSNLGHTTSTYRGSISLAQAAGNPAGRFGNLEWTKRARYTMTSSSTATHQQVCGILYYPLFKKEADELESRRQPSHSDKLSKRNIFPWLDIMNYEAPEEGSRRQLVAFNFSYDSMGRFSRRWLRAVI